MKDRNADVSARKTRETTRSVYKRFKETSDALSFYLGFAFRTEPTTFTRQPVRNIETITEAALLKAIPLTERLSKDPAIQLIDLFILIFRRGWPLTGRQQYSRMSRYYEHVRILMVRGTPTARPADTPNPAPGFIDMRAGFFEALVDVGRLRWGAFEFGAGASGDVHHIDLGNHGASRPVAHTKPERMR